MAFVFPLREFLIWRCMCRMAFKVGNLNTGENDPEKDT